MSDRIADIASRIGAKVVAELPDVGHGALGAAHYAGYYRRRMEELRKQSAASEGETLELPVPLTAATVKSLEGVAESLWPGQRIGVAQLAADLLAGLAILLGKRLNAKHWVAPVLEQNGTDAKALMISAVRELLDVPTGK